MIQNHIHAYNLMLVGASVCLALLFGGCKNPDYVPPPQETPVKQRTESWDEKQENAELVKYLESMPEAEPPSYCHYEIVVEIDAKDNVQVIDRGQCVGTCNEGDSVTCANKAEKWRPIPRDQSQPFFTCECPDASRDERNMCDMYVRKRGQLIKEMVCWGDEECSQADDKWMCLKAKKTVEAEKGKRWSVRVFCVCRARNP